MADVRRQMAEEVWYEHTSHFCHLASHFLEIDLPN